MSDAKVKKVIMFQAENGQLYANEDQCIRVNYMLNLLPKVIELVNTAVVDGNPLSVESVSQWMIDSADKIVDLLAPLVSTVDEPVIRRKRRTKAEVAADAAAAALAAAQPVTPATAGHADEPAAPAAAPVAEEAKNAGDPVVDLEAGTVPAGEVQHDDDFPA